MARRNIAALLCIFLLISNCACWNGAFCRLQMRRNRMVTTFPKETAVNVIHTHFMQLALAQAVLAGNAHEVPIGAIVVRNVTGTKDEHLAFQVLSARHNRVETLYDASAHAELLAMRAAARSIQNWRLLNRTILYSTLEPCPMCLAAAQAFRVDSVVYGASDHRLGAVTTHMNLLEAAQHPFHNISTVTSGVCEQECGDMLRDFFRKRRQQSAKQQRQRGFSSKVFQWFRIRLDSLFWTS